MPLISNRLPQSNGLYSDTARVLWQRSGLQFVAVTLNDGTVIAELPDLQLTHLTYRFEETTSETATLPWRNAPRNWDEATTPYPPYSCCANPPSCGAVSWSNASVQCAEMD